MARLNLLTAEEEIELSNRIRENDDQEAFETMVRANLGLVVFVCQKLPAWHLDGSMTHDDLVQDGNIALMQAVRTWKPQGYRFASYARKLIFSRVMRAVETQSLMIHIPVPVQERIRKIKKAESKLSQSLGRDPTTDEIAKASGFTPELVREHIIISQRQPVSLDAYAQENNRGDFEGE